jgi:hypothetical protein
VLDKCSVFNSVCRCGDFGARCCAFVRRERVAAAANEGETSASCELAHETFVLGLQKFAGIRPDETATEYDSMVLTGVRDTAPAQSSNAIIVT